VQAAEPKIPVVAESVVGEGVCQFQRADIGPPQETDIGPIPLAARHPVVLDVLVGGRARRAHAILVNPSELQASLPTLWCT
jgi:hypothetical protein